MEKTIDLKSYLIEGPFSESILDISWEMLKMDENTGIENGISLNSFSEKVCERNLKSEFKLLNRITFTLEHEKRETESGKLDRYSDIVPRKFCQVKLEKKEGYKN